MAHMVETMAYAGEVPWHGLGVQVDGNLTPEEMLKEADLDWTVSTLDFSVAFAYSARLDFSVAYCFQSTLEITVQQSLKR